jgi:hypothetical protein
MPLAAVKSMGRFCHSFLGRVSASAASGYVSGMSDTDEQRCPVCGEGVLQHLGSEDPDRMQRPESRVIETYTCGHEVTTPPLATADADRLEVERRTSDETVDPDQSGGDAGA